MRIVLKPKALVRRIARLVITIKQTIVALSVRRHVKNATATFTVLSALTEHFYNKYLSMSIVKTVHQDVQAAPISKTAHNASNQTSGEHTVKMTVSIALVIVIKMTVAPKDALMDIITLTMFQKVGMNVASVIHHVPLVMIYHIVRNAKTVITAKQILYALNVLTIVEFRNTVISSVESV